MQMGNRAKLTYETMITSVKIIHSFFSEVQFIFTVSEISRSFICAAKIRSQQMIMTE